MDKFLYLLFIIFQHPARYTMRIFAHFRLSLKVYGKDKIPKPPYILCSNHSSHLDGMLLSSMIWHKVRWLITKKHFENKKMRWIYRAMRLIPVNMEGMDSNAIRKSIQELKNNNILGIFPEGTRSTDGKIKENVHSGAAYLAIKGGVPVLPAAIKGSYKALPPGASKVAKSPVSLIFGDLIQPPEKLSKESVENMSKEIMDTITHLLDELPDRT